MRVLVVVASKHGSTLEMATRIADTLTLRGMDVTLAQHPEEVRDVTLYDAVILGSAVYLGRWRPEARSFASRLREQLETRPTWLFSSGPLGDPPFPVDDPADVPDLLAITGARGHRTFPGALDLDRLSFAERTTVRVVKAPAGDSRDMVAVAEWADGIAGTLLGEDGVTALRA